MRHSFPVAFVSPGQFFNIFRWVSVSACFETRVEQENVLLQKYEVSSFGISSIQDLKFSFSSQSRENFILFAHFEFMLKNERVQKKIVKDIKQKKYNSKNVMKKMKCNCKYFYKNAHYLVQREEKKNRLQNVTLQLLLHANLIVLRKKNKKWHKP